MKGTPAIKRGYLLAGLALILTLLSLRFAFWNTVQAMKLNNQLATRQNQAADLHYPDGYLERKLANLDKILVKYNIDTANYRNTLLTHISSLAEKEQVKIVDIPTEGNNNQTTYYKIQKIGLEGNFNHLTRCYNALQETTGIGIVRSANYIMVSQRTSSGNEKRLKLIIHLEAIK